MSIPTNVVDRIALIDAILDRLSDQLPVTTPATKNYVSEPVNVPLLGDGKHVQRYTVLHPWVGNPDIEHDLADVNVQLAWGFQLTVAAAYARDVYDLVNHVDSALYRWMPLVEGYECGRLHPPPGFDPGPARPDTNFTPNRFWLPLQYQTTITRAS
jgi:hypothetical protein